MRWENYTSLPEKFRNQRVFDGCGISGFMNIDGTRVSGEKVIDMLCILKDRENGLGAGYAAYGIYPKYKDYYAFHFLFDNDNAKSKTLDFLGKNGKLDRSWQKFKLHNRLFAFKKAMNVKELGVFYKKILQESNAVVPYKEEKNEIQFPVLLERPEVFIKTNRELSGFERFCPVIDHSCKLIELWEGKKDILKILKRDDIKTFCGKVKKDAGVNLYKLRDRIGNVCIFLNYLK